MARSSSRKAARRGGSEPNEPAASEAQSPADGHRTPPSPRKPNRWLLATTIVLFAAWFLLLVFLAAHG